METNNPFDLDQVARRVMPLIYMLDTSGSMSGTKISTLNTAMSEALLDVGEISHNNSDAQIKISILEFSSGVNWMYPTPLDSESFKYQPLEAFGLTCFGEALDELNSKLSRSKGFMSEPTGMRAPAIILMSDGEPTDEYTSALEKLKGNPWFKIAVKVAIAIGTDANFKVLEDFTGNSEAVITVHDVKQLKKIIHTVSVTASKVGSRSNSVLPSEGTKPKTPNDDVLDQLKPTIQADPALSGVDLGNSKQGSTNDDWSDWNDDESWS